MPFSFINLDIDWFKSINDRFGHTAGDEVLREVSKRLMAHLRPGDVLFRVGGEEFSILLQNTNAESAIRVARRLHSVIRQTPFHIDEYIIDVTASFGITEAGAAGTTSDAIANRADKALYHSKNTGRDRLSKATETGLFAA